MKKLLIFLIIINTSISFAAKTYDLTIVVFSLSTDEPIEDLIVTCSSGKTNLGMAITDLDGKVKFEDLKTKELLNLSRRQDGKIYWWVCLYFE